MPVSFTDDDGEHLDAYLARTIGDDDDDDDSVEGEEDQVSDIGLVGMASGYEGEAKDAPEWMLFGNIECRAIFAMVQDKDKFQRVCGRNMGTCARSEHGVTAKAKVGYYRTVAARKYADGVESTYLTEEAFKSKEDERKTKGSDELKEAINLLQGNNPANSEERTYEEVWKYRDGNKMEMEGKGTLFGKKEGRR
jgi:hypothetical protein